MVMSHEHEIIEVLRTHIGTSDYFAPETDASLIAQLVGCFDSPPLSVLIQHEVALVHFRTRFRKAYNELLSRLLHNKEHLLDFRETYELFGRWDVEYGFDRRPKSDAVMRTLARSQNRSVPRCKWLGWDMKPLEAWEYKPLTLMELAGLVKTGLDCQDNE